MNFTLTEEQHLLRESARTLLAKECPPALLRAVPANPGAAASLTASMAEWTAVADGPLVDLCLVLEEAGAVAAPGPFFATTALYLPLAKLAGITPERWGAVATGDALTIDAHGDVLRSGALLAVDGTRVGRVRTATITPCPTIDATRITAAVDVGTLDPDTTVTVDAGTLRDWRNRATVALAAEMVGTARQLLAMSVEYAKQRVQFGQPIGAFQAIQHKLADMALGWERAWSAVYYAAMAHDAADPDRDRATHVAKAAAGDAAIRCARDGIQIHGGIGYTWEHDLHLFLRRAYATEHLLGTTAFHHDQLAGLLFADPVRSS